MNKILLIVSGMFAVIGIYGLTQLCSHNSSSLSDLNVSVTGDMGLNL